MSLSTATVRIVLVGDAKTGKSSLIASVIAESFREKVVALIPETTLPAGSFDGAEYDVQTVIIDTPSHDNNLIEEALKTADAICVLYSFDDNNSWTRVETHWLPKIHRIRKNVPIILVGNKKDKKQIPSDDVISKIHINRLMSDFQEVSGSLEVSVKQMINVREVFVCAQKAAMYPTFPLCDSSTKELRKPFIQVLKRIFTLCDKNRDDLLDYKELATLQRKCFERELEASDWEQIKRVVTGESNKSLQNGALTEEGFLLLHRLFIQKGLPESSWLVLKHFGYGKDLQFRPNFLLPQVERNKIPSHRNGSIIMELSSQGEKNFTELFERFSTEQSGVLSLPELRNLFSVAGLSEEEWVVQLENTLLEFDKNNLSSCPLTANRGITLTSFLSLWSLMTAKAFEVTFEFLARLAFEAPKSFKAFKVTRKQAHREYLRKGNARTVNCFVVGLQRTGKTTLVNGLIGIPFIEDLPPTTVPRCVTNSIQLNNREVYLHMTEFACDKSFELEAIPLRHCDILCVVVDDTADPTKVKPPEELNAFNDVIEKLHTKLSPPVIVIENVKDESNTSKKPNVRSTAPHIHQKLTGDFLLLHERHMAFSFKDLLNQTKNDQRSNVYQAIVRAAINPKEEQGFISRHWSSLSFLSFVSVGMFAFYFWRGKFSDLVHLPQMFAQLFRKPLTATK